MMSLRMLPEQAHLQRLIHPTLQLRHPIPYPSRRQGQKQMLGPHLLRSAALQCHQSHLHQGSPHDVEISMQP